MKNKLLDILAYSILTIPLIAFLFLVGAAIYKDPVVLFVMAAITVFMWAIGRIIFGFGYRQ